LKEELFFPSLNVERALKSSLVREDLGGCHYSSPKGEVGWGKVYPRPLREGVGGWGTLIGWISTNQAQYDV